MERLALQPGQVGLRQARPIDKDELHGECARVERWQDHFLQQDLCGLFPPELSRLSHPNRCAHACANARAWSARLLALWRVLALVRAHCGVSYSQDFLDNFVDDNLTLLAVRAHHAQHRAAQTSTNVRTAHEYSCATVMPGPPCR